MKETKVKSKFNKGITLIALVITILVTLILVGVTVASLRGENGLINQSKNAKTDTEIAEEKEIIEMATVKALENNKRGNITKTNLDDALDNNPGKGKYSSNEVLKGIKVTFSDSGRTYLVEKNGDVKYQQAKDIKWLYKATEDGNMEIIGIDLREYETEIHYGFEFLDLGVETLIVPSTLEGKNVVKFDLKDTIMPRNYMESNLRFSDVKKVIFPDTIEEIANNYSDIDIGFINAEEIQLPNNLKILGDWACVESSKLKSITIPETVTSIGYRAFSESGLESITIPGSVTSIGESAFSYCTYLKSVNIAEGVTKLNEYIFNECCDSLEYITIPYTVTSIERAAFYGCGEDVVINFPNGKNPALEIPEDVWWASNVVIGGVEQ